ncbi:hypothetical protein GO986_16430 [Deinococcus sp. HMF7620]|uniref:DUF2303 family protein n=1 Tax=Deinococcus arboris TaxID=2682977 RepID=A0A7C9HT90_9DEIO|nr:hypothetical protein [Deinococcus arboris]MVN88333.1 hypothetical protein [Deinococcus arboris]
MSHLDKNAITEVERLTKEANSILSPSVRPGQLLLVRGLDGTPCTFRIPLDVQDTALFDLASLKAKADHEAAEYVQAAYVSDDQAILVCEDGDHRWTATLKLPLHPLYQYVQAWKKPTGYSQKQLVRLLRTELHDHIDPSLANTFASLKFTNNQETAVQVRPLSNALDSRIRQQVAQDNGQDAPETITLRGPVYDIVEGRETEYEFTVYVEYDHDSSQFILQTVHGDLREAQEQAIQNLIVDLTLHADSRWPVLYGLPK